MTVNYKRVNILIRPEQHEAVTERGVSLSGLVRDLLQDWASDTSIKITVSKSTKRLYDTVVSNFGAGDHDLEPYIKQALDQLLVEKTKEIEKLRQKLGKGDK